jgi:ParB family chromosome partitioning protein
MQDVIARGLSVRQTEALANRPPEAPSAERQPAQGPDVVALEHQLAERLGLKVKLSFNGRGGVIQIYYTDLDQLDNILGILGPV